MIKFTGDGTNGRVYFLGLSRGNIERLTAGQPIKVDLAEMGGPPITIAILFGETEQTIFDELKASGAVHPEIEYREARPGEHQVVRVKRT
jgi:hypothetical protein